MKKGTHIQTDFIKFIIEKYSKQERIKDEDEETKESEIQDEEELEEQDEKEEPVKVDEDEVLEKLINEYKKVKWKYENSRIQSRRK